MKASVVGLLIVALGISSSVSAGEVKVVEREDVLIVEYTGDGTGAAAPVTAEELDIAAEEESRARLSAAETRANKDTAGEQSAAPVTRNLVSGEEPAEE